ADGVSRRTDGRPRRGGTLTVAVQDDARGLDPHTVTDAASMRMIEPLYASLLRYGTEYGRFEPDLARDVEFGPDGLRCVIRLRPEARFHSGRPVTADDVKFSMKRIIAKQVRAEHFAAVDAIRTPNDSTVILELGAPSAPLRAYLAHPMNAIVDPNVVASNDGRLDRADAGAGPFSLVRWEVDRQFVAERHGGYHTPNRPYLDRVIFRPMPDAAARTTALRTGEVDLILDVSPADAPRLEQARDVQVTGVPGTFWEYLGFNCRRRPLSDPNVRRAVAWAIDRRRLNELVKFGRATVLTGGPIPPNHWAHPELDVYTTVDRERARRLLAEAGYPDGFSATLKVGSAFNDQVKAAQVIKQQLAEVGIDLSVVALESGVFFEALNAGEFVMTFVGWVGFVDPDQFTWNLFHSEGKYNQQGYAEAQVDRLLVAGRRTRDRARRKQIYADVLRRVVRDVPMVFCYVNPQISAERRRVRGFVVHPTATTIFLRDTWLAE
ncbi:MAG: peptide ABC transporter substrate-binding protein, partial [Alphaproteobacteria bacterium]|nr:peptide ABC transporter substrate-binding protein [Alphaproteobacteria bacterium]